MTVSMVPCPKCGTPQSPDARKCSSCGVPMGVAPTADQPALNKTQLTDQGKSAPPAATIPEAAPLAPPAPATPGLKKTMLGMPSYSPPAVGSPPRPDVGTGSASPSPSTPAEPSKRGSFNKTMLGVAPLQNDLGLAPPNPQAAKGEGSGGFKRTMLGVAPPDVIQRRMGNVGAKPAPADAAKSAGSNQQGLGGTLVQPGSEDPGANQIQAGATSRAGGPEIQSGQTNLAGTQVQFAGGTPQTVGGRRPDETLAIDPGAAQTAGPSAPPAPPVAPGRSNQRTVLGVAMPGIAPIRAGQPRPPQEPAILPPQPQPPPTFDAPLPETTPEPPAKRTLFAVLIAAFFALALLSVLAFYLLSNPYSVEAKVVLDDAGKEQLEVTCEECPDGTTSEIDGEMATFKSGKARVTLKDPLKVGNNALSISLLKPGDKHAETLELKVPVQFRVHGDLSGLDNDPPMLRVSIQAIPGTTVVLDGSAIKLDAGGAGEYKLDVSDELTGEAAGPETLEKKIPYTITPPGEKPQQGEVTMRSRITPLTLDAPGPSIVIDRANFMLAGRTQKGGSLSVAGRAITVDPAGRFAQLMSVSSAGETTISVRGSAQDHAPRLVPIKIRRVESLADEAKRLKDVSRTPFSDFADDVAKSKGTSVLVDAKVVESRTDSHTTFILANVRSGCQQEPCFARVVYGAKLNLKKDEDITISGTVAGTVDGPRTGSKVVELQADLVVK